MWRKTPQTLLIRQLLQEKGHATNQELAAAARKTFPSMTNTTVHRITARLVEAKVAAYAPSLHNVRVLDVNPTNHDHFICQVCNKLVDMNLSDQIFTAIQSQLPGKLERNNILLAGICHQCSP